jgi:hypothetical protein
MQASQDFLKVKEYLMNYDRSNLTEVLRAEKLIKQIKDNVSKVDFSLFVEHVLGFENGRHHYEWQQLLANRAVQEGKKMRILRPDEPSVKNKKIMVEAPRGHSKSTTFSVNYPLWKIAVDRNIRIIIVSKSASQAESFVREIQGHIERNIDYQEWAGDLIPDESVKWTQSEFIVKRDNYRLKDPTVSATSVSGVLLSKRADIIICDDILNIGNTRTSDQRDKTREWFFDVLMPVLEPGGQLIVVGTAWNSEDLYQELLKDTTFDVKMVYDAILDEKKGQVLWPDKWTWDLLMERKESSGTLSFNRAYRNKVTSAEDQVFQPEWLEDAKSGNRQLIRHLDYSKWDLGAMTVTGGMDLAISMRDGADDSAIAIIGRTKTGVKIPLWLEMGKWSPADQRKRIVEVFERFPMMAQFTVESNAYQASLQRDMAEMTDLPIKGYGTGGEKFDEDIGINSIAVEFENGKWILPYASDSDYTRRMIDSLVGGMLDFPSGHTADILMALWFANTAMRDITYGKKQGKASFGRGNPIKRRR